MADVVVSPHVPNRDGSRFFGSPTKLFEYMAMGKPIVASDLDQIGQVLRNGLHASRLPAGDPSADEAAPAVLLRPGDVTELVQAVLFVVEHPAWRRTLGANARSEALSKYTWSHHTAAILERLATLRH
jgi:glycosyltransferase involved in cell wall biosynthesis